MSDFCDDASAVSELYLSIALQKKTPTGPQPTGFCHNCREPLVNELRFCDSDCREDWAVLSKR